MFYKVSAERVASEFLDGVVVVLDQVGGNYYSLSGSGEAFWEMLLRGVTLEGIFSGLGSLFEEPPGGRAQMTEAVKSLIDDLIRDEILETVDGETNGDKPPAAESAQRARRSWVAPQLERYTDLQSLLLLDPIHDVDDSGWPR
jgi:hypothetical protein